MTARLLLVKSLDPPQEVTDALELTCDENCRANDYRRMGTELCSDVIWSAESGEGTVSGNRISMECTDAGLFLTLADGDAPRDLVAALVSRSHEMGAVVMDQDTAEILSGR